MPQNRTTVLDLINFPNNLRSLDQVDEDHSMSECPVGALLRLIQQNHRLSDIQMQRALDVTEHHFRQLLTSRQLPTQDMIDALKSISKHT